MTTDEKQPVTEAAETVAPEAMSEWERCLQGIDPDHLELGNWYIVHTYSGYESKVRMAIEMKVAQQGWAEKVTHVLVPMEKVEEIKRGKKKMVERRMYPGYVLLQMQADIDIWNAIQRIPGVSGFIGGGGGVPQCMPAHDVKLIFDQIFGRQRRPRLKISYELGENVWIIVGLFMDFIGKIQEIDDVRGKLKLVVDIFGRATPVEVELEQVERL
jgi:transcriptional antiterminator NusG